MKRFLLLFLIVVFAACTAQSAPLNVTRLPSPTAVPPTVPPVLVTLLESTKWELVELNGRPLVPGSRITLIFEEDSLGGFAGCNEYGGAYTATFDGTITIPEIEHTDAGCEEALNIQENGYIEALSSPQYEFTPEHLEFRTVDGQTTLSFLPLVQYNMDPADLVDTAWQLASWSQRELPQNNGITLIFEAGGTIRGFAGCRHFVGQYIAENDTIQIPALGMEEVACDAPEELLLLEGDFTTALSEARQAHLQDGQLDLFTNPGEVLNFVPLPPQAEAANEPAPSPTSDSLPLSSPAISLGAPQALGRGQIVDAVFTTDGSGIALAWANGVSFSAVSPTVEQWFQALPAAPMALTMHPDNQEVAVAMADGSVIIVDLNDGQYDTYPVARPYAYWADIAYAPDGSQIAVQFIGPNRAGPIFLLEPFGETISEVPDSLGDPNTIPYLVWTPDGAGVTLASLMESCAQILDVEGGDSLFSFEHPAGCYSSYAAAWSPDGRFLTLSSPESTIDTIDVETQTVIQSIPGSVLDFNPSKAGQPLFYSADGAWLSSKGGFGYYGDSYPIQVWEAETGRLEGQMNQFRPNHRLVSSFAGETVLSLYTDGTLTRYPFTEVSGGEEEIGQVPAYVAGFRFDWSPDGRKIAAANDNQFIIWDVASGDPQAVFDTIYEAPAFSRGSQLVALTDRDTNEMIIYDLENEVVIQTFNNVTARVAGVAFAPDGRYLAYGSGSEVIIMDMQSGAEMAVLTGYPATQSITKIIWSPDSRAFLAASGVTSGDDAAGTMILWAETADATFEELIRAENVRTAYAAGSRPLALFNPSGTMIALENLPRNEAGYFNIFVYDLIQQELILDIEGYQLTAWESDEVLLTAEEQFFTRVTAWDVATGAAEAGQTSDNGGLVFAPTGGFYAQAPISGETIARGVELRHWQENQILDQMPLGGDTGQISWSPDGRLLAATAADGTLTIWPVLQNGN